MSNLLNIEIYQVPEGQHRAGMYTFRLDGVETRLYSSNADGLNKRIQWLFQGKPEGLIKLKAMPLSGIPQQDIGKRLFKVKKDGEEQPEESKEKHWSEYPTLAERVEAFKKSQKMDQPKETPNVETK